MCGLLSLRADTLTWCAKYVRSQSDVDITSAKNILSDIWTSGHPDVRTSGHLDILTSVAFIHS